MKELARLEHVVAFIDEFDEIGASREDHRENQAVVNTLLKAIPLFRSQPGRLLIAATNFIERIDPAVIRPGRFDLVIPVGPPDADARLALWESAIDRMHAENIDVEKLVTLTSDYTPADMLGAAQQAAFAGFTRATSAASASPLTMDDFVRALSVTVPSLDVELIAEFDRTVGRYSRA